VRSSVRRIAAGLPKTIGAHNFRFVLDAAFNGFAASECPSHYSECFMDRLDSLG
jgi:hypothetical protein